MSKRALRVLFVTSEIAPFSKTGGLADVSAALPYALQQSGCDVRVLTPRYGFIAPERFAITPVLPPRRLTFEFGDRTLDATVLRRTGAADEPEIHFLENPALYGRLGIYVDPFTQRDYIDNDYRFLTLCRAATALSEGRGWTPQIIHCNDWQTGVVPFYVQRLRGAKKLKNVRSLLTIHNIAYHGLFGAETVPRIGGAERYYAPLGPFEFYGHVNFLKAGLEFADTLNTVSPTYAQEIKSGYDYGYGLESVLSERDDELAGILNGIDTELWNPETDELIEQTYSRESLDKKYINKAALCRMAGLQCAPDVPLIGMVGRIAAQKGFEILVPVLDRLLDLPAAFVLLGSGDAQIAHALQAFARRNPRRAAVHIDYDERWAHAIEAGADLFLMPSKYEPCGLNQMMSMRYGTLPVVRRTGGLADTVIDADADLQNGNGFVFTEYTSTALLGAAARAAAAFRDTARWRAVQRRAMAADFSWKRSARDYIRLYEQCLSRPPRDIL